MPEIKNSFVRGRMNLDLDERLMPSGEYREALNIQVSTSEDSDVGSVQNIPGNQLIANFDELGVVGELICIGSISDEKNNRLYWFVVDVNDGIAVRSAIIEYNVDLQLTTPIVVDINNTFLEFSVNNYITGINIVDDFLFFTDGITEPKKINIEQFRKNNHTDISVNSDFFVFDENKGPVIKEQITVIKQKPTKPPVLDIIRTNKSAAFYKGENITLENLNLSTLQPGDTFPGNGVPIKFTLPMQVVHPANTPGFTGYTDSIGNVYPGGTLPYDVRDKIGTVAFTVGHVLLLSDLSTVGGLPNSAEVKLKVNNIYFEGGGAPLPSSGGTETEQIFAQIDYSVISVDQPINPIATDYDYMVEDFSRLLFERGFPRFSYRYKYQDGEYSAFGPFTEVAFETGNFNIHPTREPYNSAMENNISQINIKDFVTYDIPEGVVEIDLLYKPENSTTVYSLDTIKPTKTDGTPNPFWTTLDGISQTTITLFGGGTVPASDTGYFPITTDIIYAALPENQLLRPYDNVPKKAKSQDFTANRLIYGNYIQNLNLNQYDNNLSIEHLDRLNYYPKFDEDPKKAKQSVKSQRTYQVGISFLDLYGRETPVFTSGNTGSVTIPFDDDPTLNFVGNASRSLQLVANNIPTIEHVYQTVKVTGVEHSGGSIGQYFFFEISDMNNLLAQEYNNFSVHNIKQYRAGQLIYEGPVRIWNQQSVNSGAVSPSGGTTKGHGRYEPFASSSPGDWLVDDVVTIETDARFFKLFVKETASEYYNLILDRIYRAEEDGNLWLSFPSSDRNKLNEDDFIILKKSINANAQVEDENKFKVIDIKNEAPDFIKSKYRVLGTFNGNGTLTGSTGLFPDSGLQPRANSNKLIISEEAILSEGAEKLQPLFDDGKGISIKFQKDFNNGLINSQRYEIISLETVDSSPSPLYKITLDKDIEEQDGWVEDSVGVLTPTLRATIRLEIKREYEEFQGRFFVKILSNIITAQYLEQQIDIQENQIFNARKEIFALITSGLIYGAGINTSIFAGAGNLIVNNNYQQSAITNIDFDPASNGVTATTQLDWQEQLKFGGNTVTSNWFIDEMYFAAHQPNKSPNFNEAGYANSGQYNWIFPANNDYQFDVSISGSLMNHTVPGGPDLVGTTPSGVSVQFGESPNGVYWSQFGSGSDNVYSSDGGVINGLEGIEQANATYNNYTSGPKAPRAWKSQIHTGQQPSQYVEEVYGPENSSGFYMHLSYSTVGVDLHDGVNLKGSDASAPHLWYDDNATSVYTYEYDSDAKAQINLQAIQNNNTQGGFARMVCNVPQDNTGVNLEEKTKTQWDPVGSNILGNYSASNEQFIAQLTPGNKFTFNNDTSQEVFTIIDVHVKRIYNHTAWNRKIRWKTLSDKYEEDENTVHYAWHKFAKASADSSTTVGFVQDRFDDLKKMIKRFGAADNRRVCYILRLDKDPRDLLSNPEALGGTSTTVESDFIQFQQPYVTENDAKISENPAVFETEPKENLDLDIYYEATQAYPLKLDKNNSSNSYLSASVGDRVSCSLPAANLTPLSGIGSISYLDNRVKSWNGNIVTLESGLISQSPNAVDPTAQTAIFAGQTLSFHKLDYSFITYEIEEILPDDFGDPNQISIGYGVIPPGTSYSVLYITRIKLKPQPVSVGLSYFNCFSFGNGVESNRIRDDFNQQFIKNGVKASTTLQQQYLEDRRTSGLIFSGLYNKNTSLNDLNQFIMAEKITKELEPTYGSIQKLFARDSDLIALCEDKIVQIFADKDAIFNADGNPQLVASNRVLGQSRPFVGEYGISKNPETFASSSYRAYFADKQRGAVLRLSMDGLTPISDAGMKDWFRDKLKGNYFNIIGSYDTNKDHYNITFDSGANFNPASDFKQEESSVTVSYKESVKGWVSFKGFVQESGVSCVNTYFTIRNGSLYSHENIMNDPNFQYNQFYGSDQNSYITSIFNNSPTTVKHFNTLNYDGQEGWTCDFFNTDLNDDGQLLGDFINKENKYFAAISNNGSILIDTGLTIQDTSSFGFQGIGIADSIQINI